MSGLILRGKIWHINVRVPVSLQPMFGRKFTRTSTKTSDRLDAEIAVEEIRAALLQLKLNQQFVRMNKKKNGQMNIIKKEMITRVDEFTDSAGNPRISKVQIDTGDDEKDLKTALAMGWGPDGVSGAAVAPDDSITVSAAIEQFLTDSEGGREKTKKTNDENRAIYSVFLEIMRYVSEHPDGGSCADVSRERAVEVRELLKKYPSNRNKLKRYRDLSLAEILRAGVPEADMIKENTLKKYLGRISGFFSWCVLADHTEKNYFDSILVTKSKRRANEERHAFTSEDLQTIFGSSQRGDDLADYWVPLLGLYTGARLNEICQLRIADVAPEGVTIRFCDEGEQMRLKTPAAQRTIPIHPRLLALGFLEFVQQRASLVITTNDQGGSLFEQSWSSKNQFGKKASRRFSDKLKRLGIKQDGKSFHSFRHTFINACKQKGINENMAASIVGQESGEKVTYTRYGKDIEVVEMRKVIGQIGYEIKVKPFLP